MFLRVISRPAYYAYGLSDEVPLSPGNHAGQGELGLMWCRHPGRHCEEPQRGDEAIQRSRRREARATAELAEGGANFRRWFAFNGLRGDFLPPHCAAARASLASRCRPIEGLSKLLP